MHIFSQTKNCKKKKKSEVLVGMILQDLYVGVAIKQVQCPCQPLGKL